MNRKSRYLSGIFWFSMLVAPVAAGQVKSIHNPHHPEQPESVDDMIRVTLVAEFGGEDAPVEAILSGPAGVVVTQDGNVYILDARDNQIKKYSAEGLFLKTIGSAGEGPGEFNRPFGMVTDGTTYLYIQDNNNMETERFLLDGTFVDKHSMSELGLRQPNLVGVLSPTKLVYAQSVRGTYGLLISIVDTSTDWKVSSSFTNAVWADTELPATMSVPAEVSVDGSHIVIGHPFNYEYRIYDESGTIQSEMKRDFEGIMPPFAGLFRDNPMVRFFSNLLNPDRLDDNWWIGRASWPVNLGSPKAYMDALSNGTAPTLEYASTWDLFDSNWNLKYSLTREQSRGAIKGRGTIGTDGRGHIYVVSETGSVFKYKVDVL